MLLCFAALTIAVPLQRLWAWARARKSLGAPVVLSGGRAKHYHLVQSAVMLAGGVAISVYCLLQYERSSVFTDTVMLLIFGALCGTFAALLMMYALPVGLYEHGALCMTGPLLYAKIQWYEFSNTTDTQIRMLSLRKRKNAARQTNYLYLNEADVSKARKLLRG